MLQYAGYVRRSKGSHVYHVLRSCSMYCKYIASVYNKIDTTIWSWYGYGWVKQNRPRWPHCRFGYINHPISGVSKVDPCPIGFTGHGKTIVQGKAGPKEHFENKKPTNKLNKHQLISPTNTLLASTSNIRHPESKGHGLGSAIARDDHCVAHLRLGFFSSFWSPGNGPKIGILHDFTWCN